MNDRMRPADGVDLSIDGENMHYFEQGVGEPTLLLIHGFPSSAQLTFGRLLPQLPPDRRVVAIDLAGLGWSDRSRQGTNDPSVHSHSSREVLSSKN